MTLQFSPDGSEHRPKETVVNTPVSAKTLSWLPPFLLELLDCCSTAGDGVHRWIFRVARHLLAHFDDGATLELIKAKAAGCGRSQST